MSVVANYGGGAGFTPGGGERDGMDTFFERVLVGAASVDELLSGDFESVPGQKSDADRAGRRLAA
ncbi:hypothetical protein [Mycobacterium persicum]|nr:hypothetical protein [Mycobacterium persicum]